MSVPDWCQDAIFYQIFPDRFWNGNPANDPPNVQAWGATPTSWGFQGGDLRGIIQKFDYLLDLGINAIYLTPIFQATSPHRYNTTHYYTIDPKLGSLNDFHELIDLAHRNQVRIILDGVFNHCGRGFFAFNDILENQQNSAFKDWFHIKHFPVNAYSPGEATDYLGWWGMKNLPKFNIQNPEVRKYILDVARYWIEQGADGWRLDVPSEIDDDNFWDEFRQVIKTSNPEAYLVGEIWNADSRWVGEGHFDGLMNYPVMEALTGLLEDGSLNISQFSKKVEGLISIYPKENLYAMYVPLGSHDTERILTKMHSNVEKTKLAYCFLFAFPGAPAIYYGDEIGLTGGKDPACRGAFSWDENTWNNDLRATIKKLIRIRKNSLALRRGEYRSLTCKPDEACYAFMRKTSEHQVLVVMNASGKQQRIQVDLLNTGWEDGKILSDLILPAKEYLINDHCVELSLPPWGGVWVA
jgi:glycosidase